MKFPKYLVMTVVFIGVFFTGLWVFAPWDEFGILAFEEVRAAAADRGYFLTCVAVRRVGLFPPRYLFYEMDAEGPMVKATFAEASVSLAPLRSMLSLKAAFRMEFADAVVRYIPQNSFSMTRGEMLVEAGPAAVALRNISVDGDLGMSGGMKLELGDMSIAESDVVMTVPPELNLILNMPMMGMYVENVSPGEWRVRENGRQR